MVPVEVSTRLYPRPAATAVGVVPAGRGTGTGTLLLVAVALPTWPFCPQPYAVAGNVDPVTTMVSGADGAVLGGVDESVTVTVNVVVPTVPGLPEITPVEPSRMSPPGSELPLARAQV